METEKNVEPPGPSPLDSGNKKWKCFEGIWYKLRDVKKTREEVDSLKKDLKKRKGCKGYHVRIVKNNDVYLLYYGHEKLFKTMAFMDIIFD